MDPAVTDSDQREARVLAAIVFTDVVGFSKLAAKNEARVYVALQRDMGVMTNLCRAHSGQVLNTMGDGMLLCFTSAVDALGCAIEIQRTLYNQSLTLPDIEILQHRIGVHLGDVIMNADNVFGDGVNVAARLQSIAQPGGICFSDTVHAVVKNKLKIDATYLGPRQLKNLGEPVKVWQVPSLGDRRPAIDAALDPMASSAEIETARGTSGVKAGLIVFACVALIGLLIFGFTRIKPPSWNLSDNPGKSGGLANRIKDRIKQNATSGQATPDSTTGTATPNGEDQKQQLAMRIRQDRAQYAFDDIVQVLTDHGDQVPDENAKFDTYLKLADLDRYLRKSIQVTAPSDPYQLTQWDDMTNSPCAAQAYGRDASVVIQTADNQSTIDWFRLKPLQYLEIATPILNAPTKQGVIDGDAIKSKPDASALQLFSGLYGVTAPS